jgi:hypothetical protein
MKAEMRIPEERVHKSDRFSCRGHQCAFLTNYQADVLDL